MKCRQCGKEINKDAAIQVKPRIYVCSADCEQKYKAKNVQSSQKASKKCDDLIELKSYINQLYNGNVNWGLVMRQIKSFKEEYGYTYKQQLWVLKYAYEIKDMCFEAQGIGIIPWLFKEARQFYSQLSSVRKSLDNIDNLCYDTIIINKKQEIEDIFE
jgi:hypothetical protein